MMQTFQEPLKKNHSHTHGKQYKTYVFKTHGRRGVVLWDAVATHLPGDSPVVGEVLQAALDKAHADLAVGEPAHQRTQQLLRLADQALR